MKKPRSTKHQFVVEVVLPQGMSQRDMCCFIRDALEAEPGHFRAEDPRAQIDTRTIRVTSQARKVVGLQNQIAKLKDELADAVSATHVLIS